jgi:hypothetical protein
MVELLKHHGIEATYQVSVPRDPGVRGELEVKTLRQAPPAEVDRFSGGVVKFDPLQAVPVLRCVVENLVDNEGGRNGASGQQEAQEPTLA